MHGHAAKLAAGLSATLALIASVAAAGESPVASVREIGPQFMENPLRITGADGATSVVLPGGDSLWVFGDTVEGPFKSIRELDLTSLRSSTAALVPRQDVQRGIRQFEFLSAEDGQRPRQIVPFAADESPAKTRLWAIHGACVEGSLYLFYHRITLLEEIDVFQDFRLEGMGIAKAALGEPKQLAFERLTAPDGSRDFWKPDQPTYGVWVERDGEYLYVWGSLMTGMFLARVPPERIADLASYEYLVEAPTAAEPAAQPRWAATFSPKAVLFDSVPNEMSVSFNEHLKCFVAIHALGREGQIVLRTAADRTGPWSPPQRLYEVKRNSERDLVYAAKEHPELAADNGRRIYVTFVSSADYVPRLIEVTFR